MVGDVTWKSGGSNESIIGGVKTARNYLQPCAARGRRVTNRRTEREEWSREENMCDQAMGQREKKVLRERLTRSGTRPTLR